MAAEPEDKLDAAELVVLVVLVVVVVVVLVVVVVVVAAAAVAVEAEDLVTRAGDKEREDLRCTSKMVHM